MIDETFVIALRDSLLALPIAEFYLDGTVPEGRPALDRKLLEGSLDVVLRAALDELEKARREVCVLGSAGRRGREHGRRPLSLI